MREDPGETSRPGYETGRRQGLLPTAHTVCVVIQEIVLNKHEKQEIGKYAVMHKIGMADTVARGLSAMIRAARTKRSRNALLEYAELFGVTTHPEFIIFTLR